MWQYLNAFCTCSDVVSKARSRVRCTLHMHAAVRCTDVICGLAGMPHVQHMLLDRKVCRS